METLRKIQQELKVPKNRYNKFGGFNYRSCEDILEAVKPMLGDHVLVLDSDAVEIGGWHYIMATAALHDAEGKPVSHANSFSREPEAKKGMDAAQISGTSESYAKKRALGNLFLIDDGHDPDSYAEQSAPAQAPETQSAPQSAPQSAHPATPQAVAQQATEALGQHFDNVHDFSEFVQKAQQQAFPAKVDAPTAAQRNVLNALGDWYKTQGQPGQKLNWDKLRENIFSNIGRWPNHAADATLIKQYVAPEMVLE